MFTFMLLPSADSLAHKVIPRHPPLRPQARMLHQFRFIIPLLGKDEDGLTPLHYYDSAIQLVRHMSREPTEQEYIIGMRAAKEIETTYVLTGRPTLCALVLTAVSSVCCSLHECYMEMREGSSTDIGTCMLCASSAMVHQD